MIKYSKGGFNFNSFSKALNNEKYVKAEIERILKPEYNKINILNIS